MCIYYPSLSLIGCFSRNVTELGNHLDVLGSN